MKYKKSVFKSLALITQLGISMMVPVALCVALGIWIDSKFHTYWVIPLMVLGMLAGGRNVYRLAIAASKDDDSKKDSSLHGHNDKNTTGKGGDNND